MKCDVETDDNLSELRWLHKKVESTARMLTEHFFHLDKTEGNEMIITACYGDAQAVHGVITDYLFEMRKALEALIEGGQ